MTRIKKLLALLMVLCLFFSLAACKDANVETEPVSTQAPATKPAETDPAEAETETEDENILAEIAEKVTKVPGTVTEKLLYIDEQLTADDPRLSEIVAHCGDYSLTNREFQIYYWMQYVNITTNYSDYLSMMGLDTSISPAEQINELRDDPITWEQFFIELGLDQFGEQAALASKATAEGFVPEDLDGQIRTAIETMQTQAQNYYGFSSANAMLQAYFGPGVSKADYENYLKIYFTVTEYQNKLMEEMEFSEEELAEYYEEYKESTFANIGTDSPDINVRHILIKTTDGDGDGVPTEEEWENAEQEAKDVLAMYEEDPTEEHFAELAAIYSEDEGSNTNGGLYESVYPGWSVQPFNDWCFAEERKPGDVGLVKVDDRYQGYHIIYYVEQLDSYTWKSAAKSGLAENDLYNLIEDIRDEYPVEASYGDIVFGMPIDTEAVG